jgi:hypothetical protein
MDEGSTSPMLATCSTTPVPFTRTLFRRAGDFDRGRAAVRWLGLDRIAARRQAKGVRIDRERLANRNRGRQVDRVLLAVGTGQHQARAGRRPFS